MSKVMKIYTSNFAKADALHKAGIITVSIARFSPRWTKVDSRFLELAPTKEMLKMSMIEYLAHFEEILSKLEQHNVLGSLYALCEQSDKYEIALLCYESPLDFCHRHLVADWLNSSFNLFTYCDEQITEWKPKDGGLFK